MGKIKIVRFFDPSHRPPVEIYQQTGIRFAFLSSPRDGYRQCHQFVSCRDFLHDVALSTVTGRDIYVYQFQYSLERNPPADMKRMRILVKKRDRLTQESFDKKMLCSLELINHYESIAGWYHSFMLGIHGDDSLRLLIGPSKWMLSPFLISMYSYLIRLGHKEIKFDSPEGLTKEYIRLMGEYGERDDGTGRPRDNDVDYLRKCFGKLHLVAKHHKILFSNNPRENYSIADGPKENYSKYGASIISFHNYSGIVSLCEFGTYNNETANKFRDLVEGEDSG